MNDLLDSLSDKNEYKESIKEIKGLVNALKEVEKSQEPKKDGIRNGLVSKLTRFKENLLKGESTLNSIVRGTKNGKTILQTIIAAYNAISLVYDLPQINLPDIPFFE
ncbi:MAG: hypothetical protein IKC07_01120 [Clostridia bacterium]|nr:hypothetical protein [Clostridia bacterium]